MLYLTILLAAVAVITTVVLAVMSKHGKINFERRLKIMGRTIGAFAIIGVSTLFWAHQIGRISAFESRIEREKASIVVSTAVLAETSDAEEAALLEGSIAANEKNIEELNKAIDDRKNVLYPLVYLRGYEQN